MRSRLLPQSQSCELIPDIALWFETESFTFAAMNRRQQVLKRLNGNKLPITPTRSYTPHQLTAKREGQRRRRDKGAAREVVLQIMGHMVRTRVFDMSSVNELAEVRRGQWLVHQCEKKGCRDDVIAAAVLIDIAVRSPSFTAAVAATVLPRRRARRSAKDMCQAAIELWKAKPWPTFWRGLARSSMPGLLKDWSAAAAARVSVSLSERIGRRTRTTTILRELRCLPGIGMYLGSNMLRQLAPVLGLQLRFSEEECSDMSSHTAAMFKLMNANDVRTHLATCELSSCWSWSNAVVAGLLRETAKLLKHTGMLQDMNRYARDEELLISDLLNSNGLAVGDNMSMWRQYEGPRPEEATATAWTLNIREPIVSLDCIARINECAGLLSTLSRRAPSW